MFIYVLVWMSAYLCLPANAIVCNMCLSASMFVYVHVFKCLRMYLSTCQCAYVFVCRYACVCPFYLHVSVCDCLRLCYVYICLNVCYVCARLTVCVIMRQSVSYCPYMHYVSV